jgi:hypothetical protein
MFKISNPFVLEGLLGIISQVFLKITLTLGTYLVCRLFGKGC